MDEEQNILVLTAMKDKARFQNVTGTNQLLLGQFPYMNTFQNALFKVIAEETYSRSVTQKQVSQHICTNDTCPVQFLVFSQKSLT